MQIPFQKAEKDFTFIIFGASGDLAQLKIFPAIYQLALEKRLPVDFQIIGFARTKFSNTVFRKLFEKAVKKRIKDVDLKVMNELLEKVSYIQGQYNNEKDFEKIKAQHAGRHLKKIQIAYLAVPPVVFSSIIENLGKIQFKGRIIIEKPVGWDLQSAKKLKLVLRENFEKDQIYLLDHYLGKEGVFNVLSLRYANAILARLIQGKYIKNIQINGLESIGIEGRPSYDNVGCLRDMIQSHLFQILSFLTMNLPEEITTETIHREKENLINYLKIKDLKNSVIRGQYESYTKEKGITGKSTTETFVAMRVFLDHQDWHEIPIYLRSGKKMKKQWTSIVIEFKPLPLQRRQKKLEPNKLIIQLQPEQKIEFHLLTKMGGSSMDYVNLATGKTIYCSGDCVDPHGRLILETIKGNRLLFLCFEEVLSSWRVLDPVLKLFEQNQIPLHKYKDGTMGPKEADTWMQKNRDQWDQRVASA